MQGFGGLGLAAVLQGPLQVVQHGQQLLQKVFVGELAQVRNFPLLPLLDILQFGRQPQVAVVILLGLLGFFGQEALQRFGVLGELFGGGGSFIRALRGLSRFIYAVHQVSRTSRCTKLCTRGVMSAIGHLLEKINCAAW